MDISRLVLVAAAALVLAVPVTYAQDDDAVAAQLARAPAPPKPWREIRGFGRVLDLSEPPVVIDEPGLYAIQQDWLFPRAAAEVVPELIQITADDVTLDLHGFTISAESSVPPATVFVITGNDAEIRYGGIDARDPNAAFAVRGGGPWLHHLSARSVVREMTFEGRGTAISDSQIVGPIVLAGESNLERNTLGSSGSPVATLTGDGNRVLDNRISSSRAGVLVRIFGNGNVVANNVMDALGAVDEGFGVEGDRNVLRSNTLAVGLGLERFIRVSGTGNTLDGNIAPPPDPNQAGSGGGIEFTADGNYYGNNRMSFSLGGTVQTDWGGNVGY